MRVIMEKAEVEDACREWLAARGLDTEEPREVRVQINSNATVYVATNYTIEFFVKPKKDPYR